MDQVAKGYCSYINNSVTSYRTFFASSSSVDHHGQEGQHHYHKRPNVGGGQSGTCHVRVHQGGQVFDVQHEGYTACSSEEGCHVILTPIIMGMVNCGRRNSFLLAEAHQRTVCQFQYQPAILHRVALHLHE